MDSHTTISTACGSKGVPGCCRGRRRRCRNASDQGNAQGWWGLRRWRLVDQAGDG